MLAEPIPSHADPILARGKDHGDSRAICGAHNVSAVAAGHIATAAIVARFHGNPEFRADLAAARDELR